MTANELRRVAVLLRTVAEAEVARIEGDDVRVVSLLNSVDPIEARGLSHAAGLEAGVRALYRREAVLTDVLSIRTPW